MERYRAIQLVASNDPGGSTSLFKRSMGHTASALTESRVTKLLSPPARSGLSMPAGTDLIPTRRGLGLHQLGHSLLHFLGCGFRDVSANHPGVTLGIDDGAGPISPELVRHWTYQLRTELDRFGDDLVHILSCEIQRDGRGAD